jgi:hypothetical protein
MIAISSRTLHSESDDDGKALDEVNDAAYKDSDEQKRLTTNP